MAAPSSDSDIFARKPRPQLPSIPDFPRIPIAALRARHARAQNTIDLRDTGESPAATAISEPGDRALETAGSSIRAPPAAALKRLDWRVSADKSSTAPSQRPQADKKLEVAPGARATGKSSSDTALSIVRKGNPWTMYYELGTLKQGANTYVLGTRKGSGAAAGAVMFKTVPAGSGEKEVEVLQKLRHQSVVSMRDIFVDNEDLYIGLQECRYTLTEIVHVSLPLREPHIRQIATSVFEAISFIATKRLSHNIITLQSIRVTENGGHVMLSDFDRCLGLPSVEAYPNTDLEMLAAVIIECLNGKPRQSGLLHADYLAYIRDEVFQKRVFGISQAEERSGSKDLVDFLEYLIAPTPTAWMKLQKKHLLVEGSPSSDTTSCLKEHVLLISFECYVLWYPAIQKAGRPAGDYVNDPTSEEAG